MIQNGASHEGVILEPDSSCAEVKGLRKGGASTAKVDGVKVSKLR